MNKPDRIPFIDALRALAITGVIIAHCSAIAGLRGTIRQFTDLGGFGVQLFFIVSAFTIFLTYENAVATERCAMANFFIRRFMRLVPVYWLGIMLYSLVYGMESRGWGPPPELWHYPFHATLTNIFVSTATSSVVPGGWSISVEAIFYLAAPRLFVLIKNLRSALTFIIISTVAGMILPFVLLEQLPIFGLGMALFFIYRDARAMATMAKPVVSTTILALAGVIFGLGFSDILPTPPHLNYGVAFLLLSLFLMDRPFRIIVNRATVMIGKMSYSAYLLHFLIIKQMMTWLPLASLSPHSRFIALAIGGIVTTLPLAYLSHRYVETSINALTRKLIARREGRNHHDAGLQPLSA